MLRKKHSNRRLVLTGRGVRVSDLLVSLALSVMGTLAYRVGGLLRGAHRETTALLVMRGTCLDLAGVLPWVIGIPVGLSGFTELLCGRAIPGIVVIGLVLAIGIAAPRVVRHATRKWQ